MPVRRSVRRSSEHVNRSSDRCPRRPCPCGGDSAWEQTSLVAVCSVAAVASFLRSTSSKATSNSCCNMFSVQKRSRQWRALPPHLRCSRLTISTLGFPIWVHASSSSWIFHGSQYQGLAPHLKKNCNPTPEPLQMHFDCQHVHAGHSSLKQTQYIANACFLHLGSLCCHTLSMASYLVLLSIR